MQWGRKKGMPAGMPVRHKPPRLGCNSAAAVRQAVDHRHQRVHFLAGVIKRQRRAHGGFQTKTAQDGLGTMVARAHGDAFAVERRASKPCSRWTAALLGGA